MSDFSGLFKVRPGIQADHKFILATFLRGLYYGDSCFSDVPKQVFMDNYKKVIDTLLTKSAIYVACLPDDSNIILGYSVLSSDHQAIHFVFVKSVWRKRGIAKALVPKHPQAVTHLTYVGKVLLNKFQNVIYDPFRI